MASRLNAQERKYREVNEPRAEQKNRSRALILMIVWGVLLLGAGAGGAAWYFGSIKEGALLGKKPVFMSLDTFTVNLQSEHSDQHLQTNLTLRVEDSSTVDLIKLHMPEVRNRILLLLSSKAASQIATVEGKKKLAAELAVEINQPFAEGNPGQSVESVLFTSFVIQ